MKNLDEFITKFLGMARNSGEISSLLCEEEPRAVPKNERQSTLPQRVQHALYLDFKQLIAHPNCMHFVLDQWYHPSWQDLSLVQFLLWTILIVLAQPLFCVCYIALPVKVVLTSMKTPYVRFLMHWSSRLAFIICLMLISIFETEKGGNGVSKCEEFKNYVTSPPSVAMCLVYLWVAGIAWLEYKEMYLQGLRSYFSKSFNIIDCVQITLYVASFTTYLVSYWQHTYLYEDDIYCSGMNTSVHTSFVNITTATESSTTNQPVRTYQPSDQLTNNTDEINIVVIDGTTYDLITNLDLGALHINGTYDPLLLSGATFSVASVLSFLSSLRDIVVLAFVGPLRVSLGNMISDIVRFLFLFFFVWVSFGLGMTQLYFTYDVIKEVKCEASGLDGEECESMLFSSFYNSMTTLFWSLFGPVDVEELQTDAALKMTGSVGLALYGVYMTVTVVVMLNALIAMMSNTYTRVEQNSEIEWRVSRTTMMAEYMTTSATLPPPFNLVPTLKTLKRLMQAPYYCFNASARRRKYMERAAKAKSRGRRQTKYKIFIRELTERYIRGMESEDDEDGTHKMKEEIATLHQTVLSLRNEMRDIRTENGQLCDTVKEMVDILRHSTTSVGVHTVEEAEDELSLAVSEDLLVPDKTKKSTIGIKFRDWFKNT